MKQRANCLQFSHANGFPAKSYTHFLKKLECEKIGFVNRIGHGRYAVAGRYSHLVDELIDSIELNQSQPIVGLGHSTGATLTLLAAIKRPDIFNHLILIEPTILCLKKRLLFHFLKKARLLDLVGPSKGAANRRLKFSSREDAKLFYSTKSLFSNFHPESLNDYVQYGLESSIDGVQLSFDKDIEAEIFRLLLIKIPRTFKQVSATLIYGSNSQMFTASDVRWWKRNAPNTRIVSIDGGHMLPLEKPAEVAAKINQIIGVNK